MLFFLQYLKTINGFSSKKKAELMFYSDEIVFIASHLSIFF